MARARTAGVLRADVRESDLYLLVVAIGALVSEPGPIVPDQAAGRMVELFLAAVKEPAAR